MPLVAGVDSSTQSTTVEIRDADSGSLVARGSQPHGRTTPPRSEQDPHDWAAAFAAAWAKATSQVVGAGNTPSDVAAISIAAQQHGLVVLDSGHNVLRSAKLWNDTESAPDATWLTDQLPPAEWARSVGSVPRAAFTISKLSWLHRTEPSVWRDVDHICLPHDWLNLHLCGAFVTDRGDASGTGYWSPAHEAYQYGLLSLIDSGRDFSHMLPRVAEPTEQIGTWGHIAVGPGTGDNMAAAIGVGLAEGQTAVSIGTSGTAYRRTSRPALDPSGDVAGFADATGGFLPLVCTLNATKVTDWVAELLGIDIGTLNSVALDASTDAEGVTVLPYFDGERTPNRPDAHGHISGLRSNTSRNALAKAAFNGVVCGLLDAVDSLESDDGPLIFVGGGSRSSAYCHTLADLSGRRVEVRDGSAAVARGAAIQAAAVLNGESIDAVSQRWIPPASQTIFPDSSVDIAEIRGRYAHLRAGSLASG